jgi:hypothetical protein
MQTVAIDDRRIRLMVELLLAMSASRGNGEGTVAPRREFGNSKRTS